MSSIKLIPLERPVTKTIAIPGSKSYTNRALLMAALTSGEVLITNPLFSDDTQAMISCLESLGISIEVQKTKVIVKGSAADITDKNFKLNAHLSGTTIRFITALSTVIPGTKIITGEEGLLKRPIKELVNGLRLLGADIEYLGNPDFPPLKITSTKVINHKAKLNGDISSQYFSALLMIAPEINGLEIEVSGNQISKPYIDMTIDTMSKFGIKVINNNYQSYSVAPNQKYTLRQYAVESDYSSAGYFLAIAALTKSMFTLSNVNPKSKQADFEFVNILKMMGNKIILGTNYITIEGKGVKPVEVNMENCPDQVQTLAVLAAFAEGITKITGVRSLRVKETERVKAIENELGKMGIKTESTNDSLTIYGGNPKATAIDTYNDHRMAMSFAVAGAKLDGMVINNPEVVSKTFPDFWEKIKQIGIGVTIK